MTPNPPAGYHAMTAQEAEAVPRGTLKLLSPNGPWTPVPCSLLGRSLYEPILAHYACADVRDELPKDD